MKKTLFAGIAIAASAVLGLAAPATAALPSINLYILATNGNLYTVDPSTGVASLVGDTGTSNSSGATLNPVDGSVYTVEGDCDVYMIDVTMPGSTYIGTLLGENINGAPITQCDSSTVDGTGTVWASVETGSTEYLAKFDITTQTTTPIGPAIGDYFDSMWFDPTDGSFRGMLDSGNLATIDPATGIVTDDNATMSPYSYGVVVDNAGNFYANDWDSLWIGATSDYTDATPAPNDYQPGSMNVMSIFTTTNFWPAPPAPETLPNTGQSVATLSVIGAVGAALLAAGALLVVRRNRASKQS